MSSAKELNWRGFSEYLVKTNRFVLNSKWKSYFNKILEEIKEGEEILQKNKQFWRARVNTREQWREGKNKGDIYPSPWSFEELNAPPPRKVEEGRMNPKGIPYLYLSSDEQTATYEVKPYLGDLITVGSFALRNNIRVVNLEELARKKNGDWSYIDLYFSLPVKPGDPYGDYIPTQFLAEGIKNSGYSGVIYKSSLRRKGYNLVLFNKKYVVPKIRKVVHIESLSYTYKESALP